MLPRNRRLILVAFVLFLISDFATTYVFKSAADFTAVKRQKITKIVDESIREIQNATSSTSFRIVEGSNGSKEVFFTASESVSPRTMISGQILNSFMEQLAFWQTLENLFELARDYNERISEALVVAFCLFLLCSVKSILPRKSGVNFSVHVG